MRGALERKLLAGFVFVTLLVALAIAVAGYNSRQLRETRGWVAHTYEVERELQIMLSLMTDLETGLRGFVLSGQEPFLDHYRDAHGRLAGQVRRIKGLTTDNPAQQRQFPELERLVAEKLAFSDEALGLAREQGLDVARQLIAGGNGMRGMDSLRMLIANMQAEEDRLMRLRQAASEADDRAALWISGELAVLTLSVLAGAYFLARFHLAQRRRAEEERDRFFTLALDILCIADADGYWKRVNPGFMQTLGWSEQELLARPFLEFVHPDDRPATLCEVEKLAAGQQVIHFENRYERKDGSWCLLSWKASPQPDGLIYCTGRDVSELKRAEEALRRSERDLAITLNSIGDGVLATDPGGKITRVNRVAEELTGWTFAEAQGRPIGEVFRIINEHTREPAVVPVEEVLATGEIKGLANHTVLIARDGTERPIADSAAPIQDQEGGILGVVLVFRDVTETHAAEKALRESEAYNRSIVESSEDCLKVLSTDGRILEMAAPGRRIMEVADFEQIRNADWLSFWKGESAGDARRALEDARRGVTGRFQGFCPTMAGSPQWWDVIISPILSPGGQVERLLGVSRDITKRKQAEEELRRSKEEAEKAKAEADRANLAKSEFLSRMSHELRTPMNAILGFAQVMEMDSPPEGLLVPLAHILKAGRHLLDLINEMLDIARIEAGRMSISVEPVRLREVVEECLELIRPLANQRSIRLEGGFEETCDRHVLADRQRLKQALLNLLSNAVKFNRDGGSVTLSCEEREQDRPSGAPAASEKRLRLSIADTGYGIPAAELPRLFEPFERLGADRRGIEGTGLGLALTKRLIELMGASIAVESEENRGSVFVLELTLVPSPVPRSHEAPAAGAGTAAPAPSGAFTVLYIEDNLSNLQLIEHVMTRRPGVRLVAAMQGSIGLDLAREHRPKLILLDLNLPDIPGREVLRRLRGEDATRGIPVVIISADATPGEIQRMLAGGAADYLTKPLDLQKFLRVIDEHLADSKTRPAK